MVTLQEIQSNSEGEQTMEEAGSSSLAAIEIECILLTSTGPTLQFLLCRSARMPADEKNAIAGLPLWTLPSGPMNSLADNSLESACERILSIRTGIHGGIRLRQYHARELRVEDNRWTIVITYYGLVEFSRIPASASLANSQLALATPVYQPDVVRGDLRILAGLPDNSVGPIDPESAASLDAVLCDLRDRESSVDIATELLPSNFTLKQLQEASEALSGRQFNKDSFRRSVQAQGMVTPIDEWQSDVGHRPAQLYTKVKDES